MDNIIPLIFLVVLVYGLVLILPRPHRRGGHWEKHSTTPKPNVAPAPQTPQNLREE